MRRRQFIAGLGSAAAWPFVVWAQEPVPVIGYLSPQSPDDEYKNFTVPFLQGLKETGYVDGQNVAIEYRWAENQYSRLPSLAADLVPRTALSCLLHLKGYGAYRAGATFGIDHRTL
jgi:putative ABC transport system substrate-binding protein